MWCSTFLHQGRSALAAASSAFRLRVPINAAGFACEASTSSACTFGQTDSACQTLQRSPLLRSSSSPSSALAPAIWSGEAPYYGQHSLAISRGFAAAAKGGSKGADGAAAGKRSRRSMTRLFSCRNDRFRSAFEQIWPTLRLTEEEVQMFRRNSRLFVVDMGKAITLKNKFSMNRSAKVRHSAAGGLLHEQDLHLDAIGEHPRYLKIRRLRSNYAVRLQSLRKLRLMLGFTRRKFVQNMYESALVQPGPNRAWKLVCSMEGKLAVVALRMGLSHDVLAASSMLRRNKIHLNGTPAESKDAYYVQPGDVLAPAPAHLRGTKDYVTSQMAPLLSDVYRSFV